MPSRAWPSSGSSRPRKAADPPITREATATIGVDSAAVSNRPITRVLNRFPLRILGEARPRVRRPARSARPCARSPCPARCSRGTGSTWRSISRDSVTADDGSTIEARAEGVGLATNTVISAGTSVSDEEESASDVTIHVLASTKAEPGPHVVKVAYTPAGGPTVEREVDGRGQGADRGPPARPSRSSSSPATTRPSESRSAARRDSRARSS